MSMPSPLEKQAIVRQAEDIAKDECSTPESDRLFGKVGVISGVGPPIGIGTSTAKVLCRAGVAHLYLIDINPSGFPALVKDLNKSYPKTKVTACQADASSGDAINEIIGRIMQEEGHLDFYFSNCGVMQMVPPGQSPIEAYSRKIWEYSNEEFSGIFKINTLSAFIATKAASKAMLVTNPEKGKTMPGGSIVFTSSISSLYAGGAPLPYDVSKAGVSALARAASHSLSGTNIRVNAILPGCIYSNMVRFLVGDPGGDKPFAAPCNTRRFGHGAEIGRAVLFLVSDDSSYMNGHSLVLDGGLSTNMPNSQF